MKYTRGQMGFTVVEMMIVFVILGILVALAVPNLLVATDRAKDDDVIVNMRNLRIMIEVYRGDANPSSYPSRLADLGNDTRNASEYSKLYTNPYTAQKGRAFDGKWATEYTGVEGVPSFTGFAAYYYLSPTQYVIYGYTKGGQYIRKDGRIYTITNG